MTTKRDIFILKGKVQLGDAEAMLMLGRNYLLGIGVDVDLNEAHRLLSNAAQKGERHAMDLLKYSFADDGASSSLSEEFSQIYQDMCTICRAADKGEPAAIYIRHVGKLSDETDDYLFNIAVTEMEKAAKQDFPPALFSLGLVYARGNRIPGKRDKGIQMIKQAAEAEYLPAVEHIISLSPEAGYPYLASITSKEDVAGRAFTLLSVYYREGMIVEQNYEEARELLKKAADKGDDMALLDLGVMYETGDFGVAVDKELAMQYYERGANNGNERCMYGMGALLQDEGDNSGAFSWFSKAAEQGLGQAYNSLGTCYKRGIGTTVNPEKALECYIAAVEHGDQKHAYYNLYLYYMDGVCVQRDFKTAVDWLLKGDSANVKECTYLLGKHYLNGDGIEQNYSQMFRCYLNAAEAGHREAFIDVAKCYRYGIGTEADAKQAFEWYIKAGEFSAEAQGYIGQCYTYGIGVEKNDNKAVEYYQLAAEHGDAQAQFDLGICYRHGEGVPQDIDKAIFWYHKAIEQGHGGAMCNLGILFDNGIGVSVNKEEALKYFGMSAEAGNPDGQFCLAKKYFHGEGVNINYTEAVRLFKEAASQGEPDSMYHLAICYNNGLGVEKDNDISLKYLFEAADRGLPAAIECIKENNISRPVSLYS